eukprot:g14094.t1
MVFPPTRAAYEALINEVKLLKEENKQLRNEIKETSRSTLEVELEPKTRDRKASRNSWAAIYHNKTVRRKSLKLLGEDVVMDDWLDWRVKWGQCGIGVSSLIWLICFFLGRKNVGFQIAFIVFGVIAIIFGVILYYKNVSLVIIKRLLKEPNVVVIVVLTICNCVIDIAQPLSSFTPIYGLIYLVGVNMFLFTDAIKLKSRIFVIICGSVFTVLNLWNMYNNTFGSSNNGVVLFRYTIQSKEYTFMKRATKRSIFLQILLFSISGIYTTFKDKKMEFMIFATGNIYRETGTASKDVEDKTYSMEIIREKRRSTNKARV